MWGSLTRFRWRVGVGRGASGEERPVTFLREGFRLWLRGEGFRLDHLAGAVHAAHLGILGGTGGVSRDGEAAEAGAALASRGTSASGSATRRGAHEDAEATKPKPMQRCGANRRFATVPDACATLR
jgi:hypothetical protein